jgi:uncharacterized protein YnzC (UPF0291/DUF896 family)
MEVLMTEEQIARINELYHKSKSPEGLTEAEKKEQAKLRQDYLQSIRTNLKQTLDNTVVEYPDGTVKNLKEVGIRYAGIK